MKNNPLSRRHFIQQSGKAGIALTLSSAVVPSLLSYNATHAAAMHAPLTGFSQQPLRYDYKALEPVIDAQTMEIHYTKHAAAYAKNLNDAVAAEGINTTVISLEDILASVSKYSVKMRNNAGGHYNHELFWKCMAAKNDGKPAEQLFNAITKDFGSYEAFTTQFADAGKNRFGSGWAWLIIDNDKKLKIGSTPNQDNPLMNVSELKGFPLLGLDVWEHAYYLKYQYKRPDYIKNWWTVVNWQFVSERYNAAI